MSDKSSSDALARIRRGRRPSSVEPRVDPLSPNAPIQLVTIDTIVDRTRDTRPINDDHVIQLIESIRVVGLITPLTIDRERTLLAGAHRLEALKRLSLSYQHDFQRLFPEGRVPARVMPISANTDQLLALRVEIEENEKRRDYTSAEVFDVAQTLKVAGFTRSRGRPNVGEKPLIPALEAIFGKSKATIKRYLAQEESKEVSETEHSIVDAEHYMWRVTQEKCESFSKRVEKLERELKRAHQQWGHSEDMSKEVDKQQALLNALTHSLTHLAKAKKALQVKLL